MKYPKFLLLLATLSLVSADDEHPEVTEKVFMEIQIGRQKVGTIEIGLFGNIVPITVKNFVGLCKRPYGEGYKGSLFFWTPYHLLQTGAYWKEDGKRGMSIYGANFGRENFRLKHYGAGWLSMVNVKKVAGRARKNNTGFIFILQKLRSFDNEHVVFGKVLKGMDVVWKIAETEKNPGDKPMKRIVISDCNAEEVAKPFPVETTEATE